MKWIRNLNVDLQFSWSSVYTGACLEFAFGSWKQFTFLKSVVQSNICLANQLMKDADNFKIFHFAWL